MKRWLIVLALAIGALAGCAAPGPAPVIERASAPPARTAVAPAAPVGQAPSAPVGQGTYTVRKGDTLYSIALDNGLDYRDLASWNGIADANMIREGQVLSLKAPPSAVQVRPIAAPNGVQAHALTGADLARSAPAAPGDLVTEPKALKLPYSDENLALFTKPPAPAVPAAPAAKPEPAPAPAPSSGPVQPPAKPESQAKAEEHAKPQPAEDTVEWSWPARGKVTAVFSDPSSKGIDISGNKGDPVNASAGGRVVYIGEGLRGYGKLVIIKHNNTFLSAYAHNDAILVKEGQTVVKGQKIAEIGSTGTDQTKLHFEIRQFGKPVDPLKFLPDRSQ